MGYSRFNTIHLKGIAGCAPSNIAKTIDFPHLFTDKEKRKFIKHIGIEERRIADNNVCASDLGYKAAKTLLEKLKIDRKNISALVFLSQTPDFKVPFTSNILQHRLNLSHSCTCLDINAGCSGFITGLQTVYSLCNGLSGGSVLFIIAETMSKIVSGKDKSTSLIFGDGAAALLVEQSKQKTKSYFNSYSDGKRHKSIIIPDGGFRNPATSESHTITTFEDGSERSKLQLSMDGQAVFDFTMREIIPSVLSMHDLIDLSMKDVDYFIFHQSNRFIIKQLARQLKIPVDKLLVNIERFGNTSGVSIPLTIVTELTGMAKDKTMLHCCGYGSGLSWGNAIIDIKNTEIVPLMDY